MNESFVKKKYIVCSQIDKYKSIIRELQTKTETVEEPNDLQNDLEEYLKKCNINELNVTRLSLQPLYLCDLQ